MADRRQLLLAEVKAAVGHALNPGSPESQSAVKWIHEFQNNVLEVEDSVSAVLQLIHEPLDNHFSPHYKLFACNSLEKLIEKGWYSLSMNLREDVKRHLESLLTDSSLSENFLSSALSRCFVEVMMREWPQKWPNLMPLMLSLPKNPSTLNVLLQLGEDVGINYKPKNPTRRREILTTINQNLPLILEYIWDCLQSDHNSICHLSLRTLTAYLEWTSIESQLIRLLFHILSSPGSSGNSLIIQSKVMACDCLISIFSRKKMKDAEVEALSVSFAEENLSILFNLLRMCLLACEESSFDPCFSELNRKICSLITSAGRFLLSSEADSSTRIPVMRLLIREMHRVFKHRNQRTCQSSVDFFRDVLSSHEKLSMAQQEIQSVIRELFFVIPMQLVKVDRQHVFVIYEFDSYADYESFFINFTRDMTNLLRLMASIDPLFTAECTLQFLDHVNSSAAAASQDAVLSNWKSAVLILDAVCNKLPQSQQFADMMLPLTMHLLSVSHQNPDLLSVQLSCISALSAFLEHFCPDTQKQLVDRILCLAKFPVPSDPEWGSDQQSGKSLRRHACSCFINLCRRFPHLLLPLYDSLQQEVESGSFSRMELASLIEGLILMQNASDDPDRLKLLICQVLSYIDWLKDFDMDTEKLMRVIGIAGAGDPMAEEFVTSRSKIQQAVSLMLALFRVKNKSALLPEVLPYLKSIVSISCNLNEMWDPAFRSKCNPSLAEKIYSSASDLDKVHLLEYSVPSETTRRGLQSIDSKMQNFLWSLQESVLTVSGSAFSSLRPEVYSETAFFLKTLGKCHFLPRMKLKLIVKHFLKPFVQNSPLVPPESLKLTIDPLFHAFLPQLFHHVHDFWSQTRDRDQEPPDDVLLQEELVNEQSNRLLSREFADLIRCLLLTCPSGSFVDREEALMDVDSLPAEPCEAHLSPIGRHLIQNHLNAIVSMTVGPLIWSDSLVNQKVVRVNKVLLNEILELRLISSAAQVSFIVTHIFRALSLFGESEENRAALLQLTLLLFEQLAKNYGDDMRDPFWQLSQSHQSEWVTFRQSLIQPSGSSGAASEKKKRDALRSLLSNVIGSDGGQKVQIKSLRPLPLAHKRNQNKDLIENCADSSLSLFHLFS